MNKLEKEIIKILSIGKIISFDNLALEQLKIKNKISKVIWNKCYMGDDGMFTMYIDLVERNFARSSTSSTRYPLKIT